MKIKSVHINKYKIFKDFKIDFCDTNGKVLDVVLLVGINGSGKTSLLEFIRDRIQEEIYTTLDGKVTLIDEQGEEKELLDYEVNKPTVAYFKNIEDSISTKIAKATIIKYIDKFIYEDDKRSSDVYSKIQSLIEDILETFDMQIEFNSIDKDRNVFFNLKNEKNKISIDSISNGERHLINSIFNLYLNSDARNSILLIDEPENSLHPNWQNQIIKVYERFARENNNQIILATHSPFIVGSVRKENIRILVREEGIIRAIKPLDGSFGWRTERILLEILGVKYLRTPEVEALFEELYALLRENEFESEAFKNKLKDLEDLIGYEDNHLKLIRLEILRLKKEALKQ